MGKQDYATNDESDAVAVGVAWLKKTDREILKRTL